MIKILKKVHVSVSSVTLRKRAQVTLLAVFAYVCMVESRYILFQNINSLSYMEVGIGIYKSK